MANDMHTRLILSAEDRGAQALLAKTSLAADKTALSFSSLGSTVATAMGGLTATMGIKKALSWIDDYNMGVLSIATTLTDSVKGSTKEIDKAFQQNTKHAEGFFKMLQVQAAKSIATFDDLMNAYTMWTSRGMSVDPNEESAQMFANIVDRIRLATRGQDATRQVVQELRAVLSGQSRPSDMLAMIFGARDTDFRQKITDMVASGDGMGVLKYMNSLMTQSQGLMDGLKNMLSKNLESLGASIKIWAMEAFRPLYDELNAAVQQAGASLKGGDSPLLLGIKDVADDLARLAKGTREFFSSVGDSRAMQFVMEMGPRMLAMTIGIAAAAKAFSLLQLSVVSAVAAMHTLPGVVSVAVMGGVAANKWAEGRGAPFQEKREDYSAVDQALDNFAYGIKLVTEVIIGAGKAALLMIDTSISQATNIFKLGMNALLGWVDTTVDVGKRIYDAISSVANLFIDAYNYTAQKLGFVGKWAGITPIKKSDEPGSFAGLFADSIKDQTKAFGDKWGIGSGKEIFGDMSKTFKDMLDGFKGIYQQANINEENYRNSKNASKEKPPVEQVPSAVTGARSRSAAEAISAELLGDYRKQINKAAKDIAGLESVMASMEVGIAKGGTDFEEAMTRVGQEYAKHQEKIAKLGASIEDATPAQEAIKKLDEINADIIKMKKDEALLTDEMAVELRKQIDEKQRIAAEQSKAALSLLNAEKELAAKKANELLEAYRRERERQAIQQHADQLPGFIAEARGYGGKSDAYSANLQDAVALETRLVELRRQAGQENESYAEAQARRNRLEVEYQLALPAATKEIERQLAFMQQQNLLMESGGFLNGFASALMDLKESATKIFDHIKQLTFDAFSAMEDTMSTVFFDAFSGKLESASDYFAAFGESLLRSFSDMLAKMVAEYIAASAAMSAVKGVLGTALSAVGAVLGFGATPTGYVGDVNTGSAGMVYSANGNVLRGGFHAFAAGGVVTGPTLGLVGEGRYNEAIVPLPDGRRIPVDMRGGSNVIVNVIDNTGGEVKKTVNKTIDNEGRTMIDIIIDAVSRNKNGARSQLKTALGV